MSYLYSLVLEILGMFQLKIGRAHV
jgi:hypothetical protein